uniref:Uncharacterized protein n=1 Tax=uncultured marine virus TaxID=186617 RepID=A0A0F7L614_9VIRU|nr:hypothetical protein [uncultured marine virus]
MSSGSTRSPITGMRAKRVIYSRPPPLWDMTSCPCSGDQRVKQPVLTVGRRAIGRWHLLKLSRSGANSTPGPQYCSMTGGRNIRGGKQTG